jgi:nickel-type superoxide dismutase maturation protease
MFSLLLRRRRVCRVDGSSMHPALSDGDRVLYEPSSTCAVGDVVLARHPFVSGLKLIKRVEAVDAEGCVTLRGDSGLASTDSRGFGAVAPEAILGRVTCRL